MCVWGGGGPVCVSKSVCVYVLWPVCVLVSMWVVRGGSRGIGCVSAVSLSVSMPACICVWRAGRKEGEAVSEEMLRDGW